MLVNHSILKEFNDFDNLYSVELCQRYKHLNQFKIHCYSISDYQNLDDAIPLSGFENDSFGFAIDKKGGKYSSTSAYIIYFPEICQNCNFLLTKYMLVLHMKLGISFIISMKA